MIARLTDNRYIRLVKWQIFGKIMISFAISFFPPVSSAVIAVVVLYLLGPNENIINV